MEDLSAIIRKELHCAKGSKSVLIGYQGQCGHLFLGKHQYFRVCAHLTIYLILLKEEADIYAGHILVYGAMIKSDLLFKGTVEEQSEVMKSILEAGSKRSYLLLPSHTFVVSLLNKVDEQSYREYIWPVLKGVIKSLPELTLETFHYMLLSTVLHPGVVKKKLLLSHIGAPEIIHEESIQTCAKLLMTVRSFSDYSHPVHEDFCEHLSKSPLLSTFWELGIEGQLEKPSESKKLIAVNMFYFVLKHLEDMSQVPTMLTPKFLDVVIKSLERVPKKLETKHDRLCARTHEVFTTFMLKILKEKKPKGKTVVKIITKLTFSSGGNFMFDRITVLTCYGTKIVLQWLKEGKLVINKISQLGPVDPSSNSRSMTFVFRKKSILSRLRTSHNSGTRVVQNLLLLLKAHSVKKVANLFRDVISGSSDKCGGLDGEEPRPWNNKERMYAVDVYARILGLPAVVGDNEWKIEQLRFLLQVGFFYPSTQEQNQAHISPLLADSLKQSFFRVLNHRLPRMEDVRNLLITLVHDVDSMIAGDTFILRQPLAREALDAWQKLLSVSASLEQKIAEGKNIVLARVFHTMFQYMGLQLLTDPKLAQDALEELHSCFERAEKEQKEKKKKKKRKHSKEESKDEEEEEPVWVEVAVDLILSLLSQNSSIPRNMLDLFFFHLCPYLTEPALGQITQVLDPDQEESPLSLLWNADDGESDEAESDDSESEESDGKQSDSDLEEGDNETVNDKLRMAVRDALGSAAPLTDTESVDIDDMDEAEGRRLDKALSEAFSMFKGTKTNKKSKKQQKDARVLMHFRIRAIDLLEIYLKSEHVGTEASLSSYIDIMLVLFSLLEFCIKDLHQKPLENRVSQTIRKIQLVFGEDAMGVTQIKEWFNRFKDGRTSAESEQRCGRPQIARSAAVVERVRNLVMADRRLTVGDCQEVGKQKDSRRNGSIPSLQGKKAQQVRSKIKVMLTVFFDVRGIVHHEYAPEGQTVTKEYYHDVLRRLHDAVRRKRPDMWMANNWHLHHDNAPAHSSQLIHTFLAKHGITTVRQPPYSPDLAPCDFWLFPKLKTPLKGSRFESREEIMRNATTELNTIPKEDFQRCFRQWKDRSCLKRLSSAKKCVSLEGVTEEIIAGALKQLMEKGERTSGPVFLDMGSKITECCTFLVRCSQRLKQQSVSSSSANDGTSPVTDIYKSALVTFFTKRDCLHQLGLFKSVLESVWDGNWTLVPILINYAFDPEVRPFRRNQALDLLVSFFRNRRLRTASEVAQEAEPKLVEIERLLSVRTLKWLQSQMSEVGKNGMGRGVKQKFVHELLVLLFAVWHSHPLGKNGGSNIDWESLGAALLNYREKVDLSAEAKISFNKLARVLGIKWIPQQKEKKLASKEGSSDMEDSSCDNAENDLSQEKNEEEETQNDPEVAEKSKKRDKKEKKRREKKNKQNKAKLRKEARELRLSSLSEGLENVTFSGLKRNVEVDKKEEDFVNEMCNGFVNSENKKVQKRKSNEIEDTQRTSKKIK
ncbi:hypothetical protein ANN_26438 [Periplaneta americana]|uniref:Mos1 transposase HTH domain-containing protein n=1 Tax=Periplaneta americana TaxID=6978 RepID=A0ABQ8RY86_PERAM|nr:hypothetical protein ANN_26438 [Periplaneta americana]